uniref:Fucosyltransferase n=1 Tax=Xenopus laevis TaxID=8355 RepID=B7ZQK2_XENLA|nr:Alpha 1,3/4 fucosyltransferase Lewis 2 [Xenopus laevis]AAI70150.1 Alpha 1,3/4 fucosyltransferase Lewis 2 [Xenopus laevis]
MESNKWKKRFFFCFVQCIFSIMFFILFGSKGNSTEKIPQRSELTFRPESSQLTILLWTWPFNYHFPLNDCPTDLDSSGCFFTVNRSLYPSANAVIIHHREVYKNKSILPQIPRPTNQYWIWFNKESRSHSPNLHIMENLINLTMSFRADSDIFTPYGRLERNDGSQNFTIPVKSKLVAWVISNWNKNSKRYKYYSKLKKHLNIDVYGSKTKVLSHTNTLETLSQYKFYLAFENSIHEDYITEKLWSNSLLSGTVPVVLGPSRKNYERFIPSDSFIHVEDFSTPQKLALYLLELDKNDERYRQYFNWRSRLQPMKNRIDWVSDYCRVCKVLKEAPPYKTIPSIDTWFR